MNHLMNNFCYTLGVCFFTFFTINSIAQDYTIENKIVADDPSAGDHFSHYDGVSIYGDYAVAGAHNGDSIGLQTGQAHLFKWNDTTCGWEEIDLIVAQSAVGVVDPDASASDWFGYSVGISENLIAIGSPNYNDGMLSSVGVVYLYEIISDEAVFVEKIFASDLESLAKFGQSLQIKNNLLIVGAPKKHETFADAGAAYVYNWDGTTFNFEAKLVAPVDGSYDNFGYTVSISGNLALVGAPYEDENEVDAVSINNSGSAYLFRNTGVWTFSQKIVAPDRNISDLFGNSVDLTQEFLVISAYEEDEDEAGINTLTGAGSVYLFSYNPFTNLFDFSQKIVPSDRDADNNFGSAVAIEGNTVIIGAELQGEDELGVPSVNGAGAAYVFEYDGISSWFEDQKIVATTQEPYAYFGESVAINSYRIIVGAWNTTSSADDGPPFVTAAGGAYIFTRPQPEPELLFVTSDQETICDEVPITLTAWGSLGSAYEWEWHEGSCDGPAIGTGVDFVVEPTETTTYCVKPIGCFEYVEEEHCKCIEIEVNDKHWHQTTLAGYKEHGNDITTDIDGNVYVTGFFEDNVVFDGGDNSNVIIPGTPSGSSRKAFVLKYDNCANLMWVVVADGSGASEGHAITMRETSTTLYIAGEYSNNFIMYNGVGDYGIGSGSISLSNPGTHGFVAHIDKEDGELYFVERVGSVGSYAKATALTIDESGSNIYVGGETFHSIGNTKIFIQRYLPTSFSLGSPVWQETSSNFYKAHLKALDFDEDSPEAGTDGALWAIGDFQGYFEINPGTGPTLSVSSALTDRDAFVLKFFDDGSYPTYNPTLALLRKGNISETAGHFMEGNDIAIDPATGYAYLTGTKVGQCIGPDFAFGVLDSELAFVSGDQTGYFVAMKADGSDLWTKAEITYPFPTTIASATGVSVHDGRVYFIGERWNNIYFLGGVPFGSSLAYTGLGGRHLYVVCYNADDGAYQWSNGTKNEALSGPVGADHFTGKICTDQLGHAFITGQFQGEMGMINGDPVFPNPLLPYYYYNSNGGSLYTMRVDIEGAGMEALESPQIEGETVGLNTDNYRVVKKLVDDATDSAVVQTEKPFDFTVIPNPANQKVKIVLVNRESVNPVQVDLFSVDGKLLLTRANYQQNQELDVSSYENGVYLVSVRSGLLNTTKKLIVVH
jgi:hypothetical protein